LAAGPGNFKEHFICIFTFKGFTKGTIYKFFKHLYLLFSFHLHLKIETALFGYSPKMPMILFPFFLFFQKSFRMSDWIYFWYFPKPICYGCLFAAVGPSKSYRVINNFYRIVSNLSRK